MGNRFVGIVKFPKSVRDKAKALDFQVLRARLEKCLKADADSHEGFAARYVGFDGWEIACAMELGEAVAEVAYAWEDEFLRDGLVS